MMKKQLMKVKKQFADQTFLRGDKCDSSNDDLDCAQKRVDSIKISCQNVHKKIGCCLQSGTGYDNTTNEKRKKKISSFSLGNTFQEMALNFNEFSVLGSIFNACSPIQNQISEELFNFESDVEASVMGPLSNILENDIPNVFKLKKQLNKLCQDMESVKSKYEAAVRHQATSSSTAQALAKTEAFKEEYDELSMKVDQQKDVLAGEMFALLSRETEFSHIFLHWYTLQADYHSRVMATLEKEIPKLRGLILDNSHQPAYGCPLEQHLRVTDRSISFVIEHCVCTLLDVAMSEEGLFRIAGSTSKVKKLKSAFDAGILTMCDYSSDPHSVAGALKSYLRELPEPLMTFELYDEWINANSIENHDVRMQTLWQIVNKLPAHNLNNLKYVIRFLAKLTTNSETNKMSATNVAIVMAPNLLWTPHEENSTHIGLNMTVANIHSSIVETLIIYADWFFPGEMEFYITSLPLRASDNIVFPTDSHMGIINSGFANGDIEVETAASQQNSLNTSPTSHSPRVLHRPGKKPAPPAPGPRSQKAITIENPILRASSVEPDILERARVLRDNNRGDTLSEDRVTPPPIMMRSATLDRPGKPKRSSISQRQSHDNLAGLVKTEMSNYEKAAMSIRNRSLERPAKTDKPLSIVPGTASKNAIKYEPTAGVQAKAQHPSNRAEKPAVPVKPPSLDNLIASLHYELAQTGANSSKEKAAVTNAVDLEDIAVKFSNRRLSDKEKIQFVDDSDPDDFNQSRNASTSTPVSLSLESSMDETSAFSWPGQITAGSSPSGHLSEFQQNATPVATPVTVSISNFDKKWDFLTGQTSIRAPDRPPRTFPVPSVQTEKSSAAQEELLSEDEEATREEAYSNDERDSSHSLGGLITVAAPPSTMGRLTRSASPVIGFSNSPGEIENAATADETPGTNSSAVRAKEEPVASLAVQGANGKVPPSPTGSTKSKPPRPQPPPPPIKPKLNNSSEDTRL